MLSSIKIDFVETEKGLQPVIKIKQEDSDDPRDNLLKSFLQKLGGQSSWLSVSFDHYVPGVEGVSNATPKKFISIHPVIPADLPETIKLIQKRIDGETHTDNFVLDK